MTQERLTVVPCTLAEAKAFVKATHRHHKPSLGHVFSVAVARPNGAVCGVAMVGRPVSRMLDNGWTLEVNRLATDGTPNACSALYGASWRTAKAMGWRRVITYILESEPGTSLRAAGWVKDAEITGKSWNMPGRSRTDKHPTCDKTRWRAGLPLADSEGKRALMTVADVDDCPLFSSCE